MSARLIELILTERAEGSGRDGDPYRRVAQLCTKDGKVVAESDPVTLKSYWWASDTIKATKGNGV